MQQDGGKNDNFDTEFGKIEEKTLAIPDKKKKSIIEYSEAHNNVISYLKYLLTYCYLDSIKKKKKLIKMTMTKQSK